MNKLIMLLAVTLLAGCGGSSNKSSVLTDKATVTPKEVHNIQPKDIPQYIEKFKQDHARLEFLLDGISYDLSFVDNEGNQIFAQYEKGLIIIGFDLDTGKPIKELTVLEGDISNLQKLINAPTRRLTAHNIEVSEKNGDAIYIGQLMDPTTTGLYPVSLTINEALLSGGSSKIKVVDDQAYITGALGTEFYIQMQDLIANSPQVKTLVLQNIEGSINDDINLHSGRLVRQAQLNTLMPKDGEAYSGGVDLFLSGQQRIYQDGGVLGVHSWCCVEGKSAHLLPKDHSAHGAQLTYVREMLGTSLGPDFYFFTLKAAPFNGIYNMTKAEITQYFEQTNP